MVCLTVSADDLLTWRSSLLSKGGNQLELDWLLDIGGGLRKESQYQLYLNKNESVVLKLSLEKLESLWTRHLENHIPLQYLVGRCPWRDFELEVTSVALIPRQETEILVDLALDKFDKELCGQWVDLGTGSGALAVALARSLPGWLGHAVDCSKEALALADRNLKCLAPEKTVAIHLGDWWEPLKPWWGSIDLAVANPPYIPSENLKELDPIVGEHEPHLALCGGSDGLGPSREIICGAKRALASGGWLMLEHHHDQSSAVLKLMQKEGFSDVDFENDLEGVRRFAIGRHF